MVQKWNKKPYIWEKIASLKVLFIKNKKPVNINEVDIKRISLSDENHMIKIYLNT